MSLLSVADTMPQTADEPPLLTPTLNLETVRMLSLAVLASKALPYKQGTLTERGFTDAVNLAHVALEDVETLEEQRFALGGGDLFRRFFLSRLGNLQIRYQDFRPQEHLGRLVGMFEVLPRTHRSLMPDEFWQQADPVLTRIRQFLGHPFRWYAACMHFVWNHYTSLYSDVRALLYAARERTASRPALLRHLFSHRQRYRSRLSFSVEMMPEARRVAMPRFMQLFAQTTRELRALIETEEVYCTGSVSFRLNPLERYPIVWLDDGRAIVPNLRFLFRNFADILHYALQEEVPGFHDVRGGLQEAYLHALIKARLPHLTVIQERSYKRGKNLVKGPDLILIDNDALILLESKARRFRADTRFTMTPQFFVENISGGVDAVRNLRTKYEDLYKNLPEYADVQSQLDRTRHTPPIFLSVLGEELSLMGEAVRGLEAADPTFPLRHFGHQWDILGIDGFERAVERAAQGNKSLRALIENHIAKGKAMNHEVPPADDFGGPIDSPDAFARSCLRQGLAENESE